MTRLMPTFFGSSITKMAGLWGADGTRLPSRCTQNLLPHPAPGIEEYHFLRRANPPRVPGQAMDPGNASFLRRGNISVPRSKQFDRAEEAKGVFPQNLILLFAVQSGGVEQPEPIVYEVGLPEAKITSPAKPFARRGLGHFPHGGGMRTAKAAPDVLLQPEYGDRFLPEFEKSAVPEN